MAKGKNAKKEPKKCGKMKGDKAADMKKMMKGGKKGMSGNNRKEL